MKLAAPWTIRLADSAGRMNVSGADWPGTWSVTCWFDAGGVEPEDGDPVQGHPQARSSESWGMVTANMP